MSDGPLRNPTRPNDVPINIDGGGVAIGDGVAVKKGCVTIKGPVAITGPFSKTK